MKLYLYRICTRQLTTDGVLKDENGVKICDTAEHTQKMLPQGVYKVVLRKHPNLGHRAVQVKSAWIIHGNGVHEKDFGASIIVGEHLVPGVVIRSYLYFERLIKRIEKVFKRGGEVELVIISHDSQ